MGDIGIIKRGGLAWLVWQEGGFVNTVVDRGSSDVSLVVYRREEGEKNKYNVNITSQSII